MFWATFSKTFQERRGLENFLYVYIAYVKLPQWSYIFNYFPRNPSWSDFYEIWRNDIWHSNSVNLLLIDWDASIFGVSGSKFAISDKN